MPAPKGHPMWGNPLNPKIYETPEQLWEAAKEYFQWVNKNPWLKNEAIKSGDNAGDIIAIPTQRPYTIQGLCIFLNISTQTFLNYESAKGYETFFEICTHIREIIYNQKFEGASVGAFNHAIIARDLGLVDKKEFDISTQKKTVAELFPDEETIRESIK